MEIILTIIFAFLSNVITIIVANHFFKKPKINISEINEESIKKIVLKHSFYFKNLPIEYSHNKKIYSNLTCFEFVITNIGNDAIEMEDISREMPIIFSNDSKSEIINFELISESSSNINAEIERIDKKSIKLNFIYLYPNTGIRVKIYCSGDEPNISVSGKIKGIPPLKSINKTDKDNVFDVFLSGFNKVADQIGGALSFVIFAVIIILIVNSIVNSIESKESKKEKKKTAYIYALFPEYTDITRYIKSNYKVNSDNFDNQSGTGTAINILEMDHFRIIFDWNLNDFISSVYHSLKNDGYYNVYFVLNELFLLNEEKEYDNHITKSIIDSEITVNLLIRYN